jgi:hypothetical protein
MFETKGNPDVFAKEISMEAEKMLFHKLKSVLTIEIRCRAERAGYSISFGFGWDFVFSNNELYFRTA